MRHSKIFTISAAMLCCSMLMPGCGRTEEKAAAEKSVSETVIETIMSRRSVRKYKPQPVGRDTMQTILNCGINAPNGMNRQSWEVRVVDNPEFIAGATEAFLKENPKMGEDPSFVNMFRNAPTVAFIANDPSYGMSAIDCGLLGENMILSAWSMGIGSCCPGRPCRILQDTCRSGISGAARLLRRL